MNKTRNQQHVILLHGLGRTWRSMQKMAHSLERAGFTIHNIAYPSRHHSIEWLTEHFITPTIDQITDTSTIHFVTHSLGGILVRQYLQTHSLPKGSRIVMLAPPNHGSEVADKLKNWKIYQWLYGPAGQQLGTDNNSIPNQLKSITNEVGIISGSRGFYLPTRLWIPEENDGLVSVQSAKLDDMRDFLIVPVGHTLIMLNHIVIQQTLQFLESGHFIHS